VIECISVHEEAVDDILKYGQRKRMQFEEWVTQNKQDFDVQAM